MSKLKLTESQVAMVQKRIEDLAKKKVLKINESQYDRLFKGGFNKDSKAISKNLKKNGIKEEEVSDINPLEFAQELIVFIKDVVSNPRRVPFSAYWEKLGLSRKELFSLIKKEGLLTMMVDENDVKSYKAKKIGFRKGIKELYKKVTSNQLTEYDGGYPVGAEFDPNAPWNQDDPENDNYDDEQGKVIEDKPLENIYFNENSDDLMILRDKNHTLYAFSGVNVPEEEYSEFMDFEGVVDEKAIDNYVNAMFMAGHVEKGYNPDGLGSGQLVIITPELKRDLIGWYGNDGEMVGILNMLPESTGAASSGAYVGGMSGGPIRKDTGVSPEEAMKNLNEELAINKFLITWNLNDNGGDTSPFFSEFHEVQEFMNKLEHEGVVTGVKVSKTNNKGQVAKEFIYDFDGQEWQKRKGIEETTSMGGASGINVGNGGDSIEYDTNAFGDSSFMKAGNKLNKKDSMPMVRKEGVNEGVKVGQIYMNGSGRAKVEKIIDSDSITIRRWGDVPAKTVNVGINALGGWTLFEGKKVVKISESQMKVIKEFEGKPNRYVAVVDFYVYANTDEEAVARANEMVKMISSREDNQARLMKLQSQDFGTMGGNDININ